MLQREVRGSEYYERNKMVVLSAEQWIEINRNIVEEFRANDGRCGGALAGNPMLLLTTTGARTGEAR
ncbi:MAG: nitroreductase/quinone reductase family protein, partial [bacterium]